MNGGPGKFYAETKFQVQALTNTVSNTCYNQIIFLKLPET